MVSFKVRLEQQQKKRKKEERMSAFNSAGGVIFERTISDLYRESVRIRIKNDL